MRSDEKAIYEAVGKRIVEARNEKNLTQKQLADLVDMNWKYLGAIEHGRQKPSLSKLISISKALEKSLDYFVKDHPYVYPEYRIRAELSDKISRCSNITLNALDTMLDTLLVLQDAQAKQYEAQN